SPPATRTLLFCNKVAVCPFRGVIMFAAEVQVPEFGSYSSLATIPEISLFSPPATRTDPFERAVIVKVLRCVAMLPVWCQVVGTTVRESVADIPSDVALMVTGPSATPVATPLDAPIVAIVGSADDQTTAWVTSAVLLSE